VFRFDPATKELVLETVHPGVAVEEVLANTGWPLRTAEAVSVTPPPSALELAAVRRYDPEGYWTQK
jgi:glutaconate CoA-transferase subunit B